MLILCCFCVAVCRGSWCGGKRTLVLLSPVAASFHNFSCVSHVSPGVRM